MKEFTYDIEDAHGMHARPAGKLAVFAKQFRSNIRVFANQKSADAKRLISLMSLGAVQGTELHFVIEGEDEEEASAALEAFCRSDWNMGGVNK